MGKVKFLKEKLVRSKAEGERSEFGGTKNEGMVLDKSNQ